MSLAINVDNVVSVLLADGWHAVANASFNLDSYEYIWWSPHANHTRDDPDVLHGGGQSGVCATGFSFEENDAPGHRCSGPLTAILAVHHRRLNDDD